MHEPIVRQLAVYLHLALASQRRKRPLVSARLWLLANDLAWRAGMPLISAYCRDQVLRSNPHHALRRWSDYHDAFADDAYAALIAQVRKRYPIEKAEMMLEDLGLHVAAPESYDSELEFLASIVRMTPESLAQRYGSTG